MRDNRQSYAGHLDALSDQLSSSLAKHYLSCREVARADSRGWLSVSPRQVPAPHTSSPCQRDEGEKREEEEEKGGGKKGSIFLCPWQVGLSSGLLPLPIPPPTKGGQYGAGGQVLVLRDPTLQLCQ